MADSLIVKIDGDTKGFKRSLDDLDDTAKKSFGGLGSVASKAGAIATAAIVGAGAAMGTAGVYAINLASDLEEVQNVVDTTFGKNANIINDWAKKAGKAFGLSELEAKKFNGTMGAMLKSMGLTDDQILEMSTSMVGLSGDFASFYNLPAEEAFAKIRSGISGEIEPLKQLGINMSVANLEAFALAEGIEKSYSEMTQAEQATLRYNYLMSVTSDAQGDFAKTSDSFANQMRILKLNISDLAASLGKILLPIATSAIQKMTELTGKLSEGFDTGGFDGLMDTLGEMIPILNPVIDAIQYLRNNFDTLAPIIAGVTASMIAFKAAMAIQGIISGVTTAIHAFSAANIGATAAQAALNFVMSLNPFVLIATLIAGVTVAIITLWKTNDDFRNAVTSAWESIKNAFSTALEAISKGFEDLKTWFSALPAQISGWLAGIWSTISGWLASTAANISSWFTSTWQTIISFLEKLPAEVKNWLSQTLDKIGQFFSDFANKVKTETPKIIDDFVSWFRDLPSKLFEIGSNIVSGLWNGISNSWGWLKGKVNGFVSGFVSGFEGGLECGSPSKVFMEIGGYVTEGLGIGIESQNSALVKAAKDQIAELSSVYEKSEVGLNIKNRLSSAKSALNSAFSGSISGAQLVAQTISSDTSDTFYVYVNGSNGEKLGTDLYREFQRRKRYKGGL